LGKLIEGTERDSKKARVSWINTGGGREEGGASSKNSIDFSPRKLVLLRLGGHGKRGGLLEQTRTGHLRSGIKRENRKGEGEGGRRGRERYARE